VLPGDGRNANNSEDNTRETGHCTTFCVLTKQLQVTSIFLFRGSIEETTDLTLSFDGLLLSEST
jgi:hypothetical protein